MNDDQFDKMMAIMTEILAELRAQRKLVEQSLRQQVVVSIPPVNAVTPQRFLPVTDRPADLLCENR